MSDFQIPVNDGVESLRVDAELTQGKRFLQRMMSSPALGCIFFRKELSERQELLLTELTLAAITRASSSALSFVFAAGFVAYLSASVNHEVYGAIIFLIGLAAAVARMAAKRRFGKDLLSDPSIRRLAHSQVVVASVMGSLMWAIGLVVVYPALDADLRTVFLLLVVGSTTVGAGFMTLAAARTSTGMPMAPLMCSSAGSRGLVARGRADRCPCRGGRRGGL